MSIERIKTKVLANRTLELGEQLSVSILLHFYHISDSGRIPGYMVQDVKILRREGALWRHIKGKVLEQAWLQLEQYFDGEDESRDNIFVEADCCLRNASGWLPDEQEQDLARELAAIQTIASPVAANR